MMDRRRRVPDLVIFDCDGVLVDSELIFARVLAECLVEADLPATTEEALALGFGKNRATLCAAVESRFGRPLSDEFFETMRARTALVLERELQPIPGVEAAIAAQMPVVGFCGGSHCPDGHADRLSAAGCSHVFARMTDLAAYLRGEPCG